MNTPSLRTLKAKFYAFAFFNDLLLIYPFYTLLFADQGVSPGQIATLLMVWSGVTFLLEVPSGAVADKFNRRNVLLLALGLQAAGFVVWLYFQQYWGFMAGFVLWGVSSALMSGTKEALLYDELAKLQHTSLYTKVIGGMESFGLAGTVLAGLLAAVLAREGYDLLLVISIAAVLFSAIAIALLPSSKRVESTGEQKYLTYLKSGIREALTSPVILLIVLFLSVATGVGALDEYYELFFREKGFDNTAVAFWFAVVYIFGMIGSLLAHKLEKQQLPQELLLALWAGTLLAAAALGGIAAPLGIGLFTLVFYLIKVLFTARLQHAVSDSARATTTSVSGLLSEVAALGLFAGIGWTAGRHSYEQGFTFLAVLIALFALFFWVYGRLVAKKKPVKQLGL